MRYCKVFKCGEGDRSQILHKFPKVNNEADRTRVIKWVKATANPEVRSRPLDNLQNFRLCRKHFSHEYLLQSNRLAATAIPTLFLPEEEKVSDKHRQVPKEAEIFILEVEGESEIREMEEVHQDISLKSDQSETSFENERAQSPAVVYEEMSPVNGNEESTNDNAKSILDKPFKEILTNQQSTPVPVQKYRTKELVTKTQYEENEFDCFAKYVACHLKKLPENLALESMVHIQSYLVKQRIRSNTDRLPLSETN